MRQTFLDFGSHAAVAGGIVFFLNDTVGVAGQDILIDVGGLAPLVQALHALGERELSTAIAAVTDINLVQFTARRRRLPGGRKGKQAEGGGRKSQRHRACAIA